MKKGQEFRQTRQTTPETKRYKNPSSRVMNGTCGLLNFIN